MRLHVGLPLFMWANVIDSVVYLIIGEPTSYLDGGISKEFWASKYVNYSFLKVFGTNNFIHINKENRNKLYSEYQTCYFIRYKVDDLGYRLWYNNNWKILNSIDVTFNEKFLFKDKL